MFWWHKSRTCLKDEPSGCLSNSIEKCFKPQTHPTQTQPLFRNLHQKLFDLVGLQMIVMLSIGLGHPRFIHTDLNLLTQIITLILILVSLYCMKKSKIRLHAATMAVAAILHILTFLLVMGPIFFQFLTFFFTETSLPLVQTTWIHAVPGAITLVMAIFLVVKWAVQSSNITPCYKRKRIMDVTLILWVFSLIFGIATYLLFYL